MTAPADPLALPPAARIYLARDLAELHHALREIAESEGIARRKLDELAGLADGHTEKLLADPPLKHLGPVSLFPLLGALGRMLLIVEDPGAIGRSRRMPRRKAAWTRSGKRHWRHARRLSIIQQHATLCGKMGATACNAGMTPAQRSQRAKRAAKRRWYMHRHPPPVLPPVTP